MLAITLDKIYAGLRTVYNSSKEIVFDFDILFMIVNIQFASYIILTGN